MILDFRSDTVTQPDEAMRSAMATAQVGDDVFHEDPTVRRLEEATAELLGHEDALFVPSGTMGNLIACGLHCARGDELILERRTHTNSFEAGGASALLGAVMTTVDCADGLLRTEQIQSVLRPENDHFPRTRLVVVENTANLIGGVVFPLDTMREIRTFCDTNGLRLHLDGARLWNAAAATGQPESAWGSLADTVSVCLSKGLGCPAGSLLAGNRDTMKQARRLRKMLGGGMRQVGVLAAAGLHALANNRPRLHVDHRITADLGKGLRDILPAAIEVKSPQTNILILAGFAKSENQRIVGLLEQLGIRALALGLDGIRFVSHRNLPEDAARQALDRITKADLS